LNTSENENIISGRIALGCGRMMLEFYFFLQWLISARYRTVKAPPISKGVEGRA